MEKRANISAAVIESVGSHGGMDAYDLRLCSGLTKAGCKISLYTSDCTSGISGVDFNIYRVFKGAYGKDNRWLRLIRYIKGSIHAFIRATIAGESLCHLHFFHGGYYELFLAVLAKLTLRKVVITVHDVESFAPGYSVNSNLIARIYNTSDRLITHNRISKDELVARLKINPAKISIIPHGNYIENEFKSFSSGEGRTLLGLGMNSKVVLFFGQIKHVKGLDLLIEAMATVARDVPEVILMIAGRPWKTDFSGYEELIDKAGIRDRCILHIRFIEDEEIPQYFAAADIIVLPYRKIYQSGVILMAMSLGKPVLVSDLPGMTEIITDGENGYVFERESISSLSNKLIRILRNDRGRAAVAANGWEYVKQHHDWSEVGRLTAEVYHEIVGNK